MATISNLQTNPFMKPIWLTKSICEERSWASLDEGAKQATRKKGYNFDLAPLPPKIVDLEFLKTHLDNFPKKSKNMSKALLSPLKHPLSKAVSAAGHSKMQMGTSVHYQNERFSSKAALPILIISWHFPLGDANFDGRHQVGRG